MAGPMRGGGFGLMDLMNDQPAAAPQLPALDMWQQRGQYLTGDQLPAFAGGGGGGGTRGGFGSGTFPSYGEPIINDPRQVAADAGLSLSDLARGFGPRPAQGGVEYSPPNDRGGFFRIEDLYGLTGTPTLKRILGRRVAGQPTHHVVREGAIDIPSMFSGDMRLPSTNNWRLLPEGYNKPGYIMRNGAIIDMEDAKHSRGFPAGARGGTASAEHGNFWTPGIALGTGAAYGYPNMFAPGTSPPSVGWPGAVNNWRPLGGPPGQWMT